MDHLKFPIGQFDCPAEINNKLIDHWIGEIALLPTQLREMTGTMTQDQLDISYRSGGWTSRQVVHHLADSHMNSYIRFKLAMTEETPAIRPYYEDRWALLSDYKEDIKSSLWLLEALHAKWVSFLRGLSKDDWSRQFMHPEHGEKYTLAWNIGNYAWHGNHHCAHIALVKREIERGIQK